MYLYTASAFHPQYAWFTDAALHLCGQPLQCRNFATGKPFTEILIQPVRVFRMLI